MICINCHGPNMDSKGRQADTVQQFTGGRSRVANFLGGLFGPTTHPGDNRQNAFADALAASSATADDWGARYMSWMALGGTSAPIPRLILNLVGRSVVAGSTRSNPLVDAGSVSANMLEAARLACIALYVNDGKPDLDDPSNRFGITPDNYLYKLILTNGDAELWEHLCSINNPPLVRVIRVQPNGDAPFLTPFLRSSAYPANSPIGNQRGEAVMSGPNGGVTDDNYLPWCVSPPQNPNEVAAFNEFVSSASKHTSNGQPPPICPSSYFSMQATNDDLAAFGLRGAINAGFAVFRYIDLVSRGKTSKARFDECTLVAPSP
jgi:hypothetical protein